MRAKVEGLERLKAKISRLPQAAKDRTKEQNLRSARLHADGARIRLKKGAPERGHLEDTIRIEAGATETGSLTRVGGPTNPYPLSLEVGHKAPDGSHVTPVPYWYPAQREAKKEHDKAMPKLLRDVVADIIR